MTSVEQATKTVLQNTASFGEERIPFHQATGRVLCEGLYADRDFPPFDRVSMDGITIQFEYFKKGKRVFKIEGLQAAGAPQMTLQKDENCLEVMTGAMLPLNTDTVIRYEDLEIRNGQATILIDEIKDKQNIHRKGTDRAAGSLIVRKGCKISAAEIGVAATVGKAGLLVSKMPKVAIISTGDELVEVNEKPQAHQIRKSNVHNLAAMAGQWGITADLFHLLDEKEAIRRILSKVLVEYDALLMSGGVSMGKLDFLPEILEELGVKKLFHKVSQRPGKPFWFGRTEGAFVFAFPGNPVSSFMCLNRYFQPWLRASLGLSPFAQQYAVLGKDFSFKPDLTYFLQVKLENGKDGKWMGMPLEGKGSGDLANLVETDAFMELPKGRDKFKKGEVFPVFVYR
ncbi:MAG TPA: molybdopterin molybdenumtransferase MoeA [Bacteroidetes bacterium]|nr:molybdopterin molybdenumtransferase MoeA [Bacteroidota bacterium]